ncbi:hypothetical protein [uncultured Sphingomonas sp.]|uniref:hypothetical protein n=1 Tax=uncultured Sphingomonas sp. TaxID=158754 RepID=UPI0035CCA0EA
MKAAPDHHISQRVKVGAIGLAAVVLLIVLAGAIMGAVSRQRTVTAIGGLKAETVANMALANDAAATEPLAAMGVTPATGNVAARR